MPSPALWRRTLAEFVGTAMLVTIVVGSGIAAERLSPTDVGLQLLENALVTALGLTVLILVFGPASGAHFNPVVTLADWVLGRRRGSGRTGTAVLAAYIPAQCLGACSGTVLAHAMFDVELFENSRIERDGAQLLLGEVVATAGLVFLIFALGRTGQAAVIPAAVGAYIGAAYFFTSSTSFANPAVTLGRAFTNTFAGIDLESVPAFVGAQLLGGLLGIALLVLLYPRSHEPKEL